MEKYWNELLNFSTFSDSIKKRLSKQILLVLCTFFSLKKGNILHARTSTNNKQGKILEIHSIHFRFHNSLNPILALKIGIHYINPPSFNNCLPLAMMKNSPNRITFVEINLNFKLVFHFIVLLE